MPFLIPNDLYYVHSMTTIAYTHRPQNKLNINRLLRQEPCWESRNSSTSLKPKTLIIADWSLGYQSKERLIHILYYIDFLLEQGFLIYVWYDDDFVKLEDPFFFNYKNSSECNPISLDLTKILPQQTDVIKDNAVGQLGIPRDHLFVLQSNHLDNFSRYHDGYWFQLDAIPSYIEHSLTIRLVEFLKLERDKIDGVYDLEEYQECPYSLFPFLRNLITRHLDSSGDDYGYFPHLINVESHNPCKQLDLDMYNYRSCSIPGHLAYLSNKIKSNLQSLKALSVMDCFFDSVLGEDISKILGLDLLRINFHFDHFDFTRFNQFLRSNISLTHLKINNLKELPTPVYLGNIKKLEVCIEDSTDLSKLSRNNLLETLRLGTGLEKLRLQINSNSNLVQEYWPSKINLKGLKKIELWFSNSEDRCTNLSTLIEPLIAHDAIIKELNLTLIYFSSFTEQDQHCLAKFKEITFSCCQFYNLFENRAFPNLQKLNLIHARQNLQISAFENCEFPALTHLCIEYSDISLDIIKRIIKAAPNLQYLVVNQPETAVDDEFTSLLLAIPNQSLLFQKNEIKYDSDSDSDASSEMAAEQGMVTVKAAAEIRPVISKSLTHQNYPLDARTSLQQNSQPLQAKQIFRGPNGEDPGCMYYRLKVYDEMRLENFENILHQVSENQLFDARFDFPSCLNILGHELFIGECELELSQNWIALPSLSMSDKLIAIHTVPDTPDLITTYSNRLNLRYISSPSMSVPQKRRVVFQVETAFTPLDAYRSLPQVIVAQIEELKSFTSGELQGDTSTPLALLQTLKLEKKGACRHRAILFKKFANDNHLHCRVVVNDVHAFVELLYNQTWYVIDLGGYPSQLNILPMKKSVSQKMEDLKHQWHQSCKMLNEWYETSKMQIRENLSLEFAGKYLSDLRISFDNSMRQAQDDYTQKSFSLAQEHELFKPSVISFLQKPLIQEFTENETLIDYLSQQKDGSRILIDTHFKEAGLYSLMLHEALQTQGCKVFIAHSSDDLMCSSFLELQPDGYGTQKSIGGPLYDFLSSQGSQLVLIINYTNFKPDEIVRYSHGLFDREPKVDGQNVPKHLRVIGIFDSNHKDAYLGDDFLGRFGETVTAKAKPNWPPIRFYSSFFNDYQIELSGSLNWQMQLSGHWSMRKGQPFFMLPFHANIPEHVNLILNNPPYQDKSFYAFIGQAMLDNRFGNTSIKFTYNRNWAGVEIEPLIAFSANTFILNAETASQFIKQFDLSPEGLTQIPGYIEQHASQTIEVYVNDALDEMIFDELFQFAMRFNCRFRMAFAPDLIPDEFFNEKISTLICNDWRQNMTITHDADLFISQRQLGDEVLLIHVDELTLDDIFFEYKQEHLADKAVVLRNKNGIYRLIEAGHHVILTGHFSEKLLVELSAFLFAERENQQLLARLMIITDTAIPGFSGEMHQIADEEKYQHLSQLFPEALVAQENLSRPFVECCSRLLFKQRYPHRSSDDLYLGLNQINRLNWNQPINFETAAQDAGKFSTARLEQVNQVLLDSPYVFIAGLTGVGKSQFIEKEYRGHQLFREKTDLMAWARAVPDNDKWVILFFDEANLQDSQWMAFEGIFSKRPYVFIDGEIIYLSPLHKLIFSGNPAVYGDDRKTPKFIQRHGLSIVFEPLSSAFIFQKVILPLVRNGNPSGYLLAVQLASAILPMYQFLLNLSTQTLLVTPRQIETIMHLILQELEANHPQQIEISKSCTFYCHEVFAACLNESDYAILSKHFPNQPKMNPMYPKIAANFRNSHFYMTTSRVQVIEQIMDFLSLKGGIKRLVLEGEPGVGKSDLMLNVLRATGRENETFVYMPASLALSEKKALLFEAFDRGQVVFTDEINTSVFFEQILNSLLDNKHPEEQGRPAQRPGFKLIGTQNGIALSGRTLESPAVKSRSMLIRLPRYSAEEIYEIAIHLGLSAYSALKLKQAYATVNPSFRRVLRWIDQEKATPNLVDEQRFFQQLLDDQGPQEIQQRLSAYGA